MRLTRRHESLSGRDPAAEPAPKSCRTSGQGVFDGGPNARLYHECGMYVRSQQLHL